MYDLRALALGMLLIFVLAGCGFNPIPSDPKSYLWDRTTGKVNGQATFSNGTCVSIEELILDKYPQYVNLRNKHGNTLLYEAARNGIVEYEKILIDRGAEIDAVCWVGDTPLLAAASCRMPKEALTLLLDRGANVNTINIRGQTALSIVCGQKKSLEAVKLLVKKGALVNVKQKGASTALHNAASRGDVNVMKFLIEHKAEVNVKDQEGNMPLHCIFSDLSRPDVGNLKQKVKLLVDNSAKVNAKNYSGKTPLQLAKDSLCIQKQMLQRFNSNPTDKEACDAVIKEYNDVFALLEKHGR